MEAEVMYEGDGHVRILTLNRPDKLNALTLDGFALQSQYLQEFKADKDAWVLILTGSGRAFSTGLDLSSAKDMLGSVHEHPSLTGPNVLELWKPVVAAVNGFALGGGCELALACDIRIAQADAQFGLPEVTRSLIPGVGGIQRLVRSIPFGDAMRLLLTGERIDAAEAHRLGLAQIVADGNVLKTAVELAERICGNGPLAVRAVKEAAYRGRELPLSAALAQDQLISFRNRQSEDAKEGINAFVEKRTPEYFGR